MSEPLLRRITVDRLPKRRACVVDETTMREAARIVSDVTSRGEQALREHAVRLGDLDEGAPLVVDRAELDRARDTLAPTERGVLERTAARIRRFAEAQLESLAALDLPIPGGVASHRLAPVESAGCYAPAGRFPLPSSVLMTVVPARVAGVERVWVASPRPTPLMLAASAIAGADAVVPVGGAQAIAALAYGAGEIPPFDIIVGPGNRWVTAAKRLVAGDVGIDMLAGPSELVILADRSADPALIAADLLAQAEHDPDALPILVTTDNALADGVDRELEQQLADLPTPETARAALSNGYIVQARNLDEAIGVCNRLAPEHLEICVAEPRSVADGLTQYGSLFIGSATAEVYGDYGAGPNHVLPTGGTARYRAGLSVFTFIRLHTQLEITDSLAAAEMIDDAIALARLEGLEAHARAAEARQR